MIFEAIPQLSHFGRHRACCNSVFYRAVSMRQLEYIIEVDSNSITCIWTFGLLLGKPLRLMENIGVVPVYKNAVHVKIVHLLQRRAERNRPQCTIMRHVSSIKTALRQAFPGWNGQGKSCGITTTASIPRCSKAFPTGTSSEYLPASPQTLSPLLSEILHPPSVFSHGTSESS